MRRGYSRYNGANTGQRRRRPPLRARGEQQREVSREQGPAAWVSPVSSGRLASVSLHAERVAHARHTIRFLHTAACSRQSCFDTPLGCESLAMIYKWEPTSDARVTLIAHGEPVYSTRDIRNSPAVRDGGRATPSGRTRGINLTT